MISTLVIKFAARCNINCTYCYEYQSGDESWKSKPKFLSPITAAHIGFRIKEYAVKQNLSKIKIVAHGGEPLLLGAERLATILKTLREAAMPIQISFSIQTNGLLLSQKICDVLRDYQVKVGISLDGGFEENRYRVDFKNRPTWERVAEKIIFIKNNYPDIYGGILCVVDPDTNPESVVSSLLEFEPPQLDLLHPYVTHDGLGLLRESAARRFGAWMKAALLHWIRVDANGITRIRIFEDVLQGVISGQTKTDWFGPRGVSYLIIESDGQYDLLDQLKVIGQSSGEYRKVDGDIFSLSIADAENFCLALLQKFGGLQIPTICKNCIWEKSCGGGHLTARYSKAHQFNNPSVYCEGLMQVFSLSESIMRPLVDEWKNNSALQKGHIPCE